MGELNVYGIVDPLVEIQPREGSFDVLEHDRWMMTVTMRTV